MITILQHRLSQATGRKYQKIAEGIRAAIQNGILAPGDRLPPQRELADALGVTHGTVTRAYQEIDRLGLVRGEVGRGTFVARQEEAQFTLHALHNQVNRDHDGTIRFDLNFPVREGTPELSQALQEISRNTGHNELLHYQPTPGLPRHRQIAREWLKRQGLITDPGQIAITAGAQQALFVSLGSILSPGDCLACDGHTYPGLLNLSFVLHIKLIPVASDDGGMLPDALAKAAAKHRLKGVYLIPTLHNPTTVTMTDERRKALAKAIQRLDLILFEDDVYGGISLKQQIPVTAEIKERSFYLTSMSKTLSPGLRVGFLHMPQNLISKVEQVMAASIWMTPPLTVEICCRWIQDGTADIAIKKRQQAVLERGKTLSGILQGYLLQYQLGSPHAWLHLPRPWTGDAFARKAAAMGVQVIPSGNFETGRTDRAEDRVEAVRICLGPPKNIQEVAQGATILSEILNGPAPKRVPFM